VKAIRPDEIHLIVAGLQVASGYHRIAIIPREWLDRLYVVLDGSKIDYPRVLAVLRGEE
jgi:hypothetical protein